MGAEPLVLAGFVTLVVGYFVAGRVRKQLRRNAWQAVASELDLTVVDEFGVEGTLRGIAVSAQVFGRGYGNNRDHYTRYIAQLDPGHLPAGLELRREGVIGAMGEALGFEDQKTGLEDVDRKLRIRAESAEELQRWAAQPEIAEGLRTMADSVDDYVLIAGLLSATTYGIASQKWLRAGLRRTARIAEALSRGGP